MTIKQLRALLFDIDDQKMTVKELRALLFELDDNSEAPAAAVNEKQQEMKQ